MTKRIVPLAVGLAVGCAESDMLAKASFDTGAAMDWGEDAETDDSGPARLRVDVVPNGDSAYLPQSVVFDLATQDTATLLSDLVVQLAPSRTVAGQISAFEAAPHDDVSVPGTLAAPFVGRISMSAASGLARRSVDTRNGDFTLRLPAGDYRLAVLPADSEMQPFYILDPYSLQQDDSGFELSLGFGSPVYGRVVQTDGTPAPGITEVWLEDTRTGLAGPRVATDGEGNYVLRAFPGAYRVVAEGNERSTIPRVAASVTVEQETATRVDLGVGTVAPVEASGRVLDADGSGLYQATIRFT
ncbi:MAG: carboxypeptidase-like regulatory domain-containing protein, partial [Myxococcota bacterium]|nr:carboxypeptidase-like regulatory domain-containing protein [Myxococcota bacterium]